MYCPSALENLENGEEALAIDVLEWMGRHIEERSTDERKTELANAVYNLRMLLMAGPWYRDIEVYIDPDVE